MDAYRLSGGTGLMEIESTGINEGMPQAIITYNASINQAEYENRKNNSAKLSNNQRLGTVTGDLKIVDVCPHEIVFAARKNPIRMGGSFRYGGVPGSTVFSSFNGINVGGASTDTEFALQYRPIGVAKIPYYFNNKNQPKQNISVIVGGTATTWNTGRQEFYPGDLVYARTPPVNEKDREEQYKTYPKIKGISIGKLLAITEPFDYHRVKHLPKIAVSMLVSDENRYLNIDLLALDNQTAFQHVDTEISLHAKRAGLWAAWATIATAAKQGLVTISVPNRERPTAPTFYNQHDSVFNIGLPTINVSSVQVQPRPDGQGDEIIVRPKQLTLQEQKEFASSLTYLAYKLGLVTATAPNQTHLKPNYSLQEALLGRIFHSLLPDLKAQEAFSVERLFPSTQKSRKENADGTLSFNRNTVAGIIAEHQSNAFSGFIDALTIARESELANVIGTATDFSRPGRDLHIVQ